MWEISLWDMQLRGGPLMWPLLAFSVMAMALILDRLLAFAWHSQRSSILLSKLAPLVRNGHWEEAKNACGGRGIQSQLALIYLHEQRQPKEVRDDILQREGKMLLGKVETRVRWLGIVGQLSPMLGLLGTVTGLVAAFVQVDQMGGQVQPSHLAGGIWEALLTTVFGLSIAIPSMAMYHVFDGWVEKTSQQMRNLISYLDQWKGAAESSVPVVMPADAKLTTNGTAGSIAQKVRG